VQRGWLQSISGPPLLSYCRSILFCANITAAEENYTKGNSGFDALDKNASQGRGNKAGFKFGCYSDDLKLENQIMINKNKRFLGLSVASFALAGLVSVPAMAGVMKFHHDLPEDSAQHAAALKFKDAVDARSNGEIEVKLFPSNALGNDVEATQQMQLGAIQGGIIPTAKLSSFVKSMQLVDLPFIFPSPQVAHKVLDGDAGKKLLGTLDKVGLHGLTFWESGFKQFTCDHPVTSPADFKGHKVRVMQSPIIMEQFKALGANPVPIAFTETYSALQQKVVECQENPLVSITKMKFYEVQSDVVISNHAYLAYAFVVSKRWFDGLSDANQEIISDAAVEFTAFQREDTARREAGYLETIKSSGTNINTLTPEQLVGFQEATRSVHEQFADDIGRDLLEAFYKDIESASK
jgi:tripartite ATP-independent transporter DctP family solute receptor